MTDETDQPSTGTTAKFVLVRDYTPDDLDALRKIHGRQGFDYALPNIADPIFVSKLIIENADGRIVMASLARLTCEIYLLVDREGGGNRSAEKLEARERYDHLLALHRAGERDLLARGLEDAHAWLPPSIARRFGRRLESLGWVRDDSWTPYCRRLRP